MALGCVKKTPRNCWHFFQVVTSVIRDSWLDLCFNTKPWILWILLEIRLNSNVFFKPTLESHNCFHNSPIHKKINFLKSYESESFISGVYGAWGQALPTSPEANVRWFSAKSRLTYQAMCTTPFMVTRYTIDVARLRPTRRHSKTCGIERSQWASRLRKKSRAKILIFKKVRAFQSQRGSCRRRCAFWYDFKK